MDDSLPTAELRHVRKDQVQPVRGLRRTAHRSNFEEGHGHAHGEKDPSILTAMASAMINFVLMFGLCCAYSMIMFEDPWNARHRGLAVKMNLCSALIMGLLLARFSRVGVAIGGPDLNPVVFLGMFVQKISVIVAKQRGLGYPGLDERRLSDVCSDLFPKDLPETIRQLGGGPAAESEVEWCSGSHYELNALECDRYHSEVRATTIFAVAVSSAILGALFFCLGKFRLTRFVSYVPTNIMEAFLSCVGYKVFKYALKFCKYKPQQFVPAACVGVPLYFMKAMHIGNPAIVIPSVLLVPLAIFYVLLFAFGGSVYSAREAGWMFDTLENVQFYSVWTDSVGKFSDVNMSAWLGTMTDLVVMIIVCLLDCMLKVSSTESKLPVTVDKDYEVQLYGLGNFLTPMCGASVGYMQLKFNIINFGVMGNVEDRRGGAMYAILCGIIFFWTTDLFNYLPRFFLSTLLFFAGSGFVVENLWGSRKYLSSAEWLQNIVILGVFVMLQSLLYAVVVGGLIAGATFIIRCANVPCSGKAKAGGEGKPLMKRSIVLQRKLQHIANCWVLVINLKGYIFFAAASKLIGEIRQRLRWEKDHLPEYQRLHWIIFDCAQLEGLDSSASKAFAKLGQAATVHHLDIVWSRVAKELIGGLQACGTITDDQLYSSLSDARNSVENAILEYLYDQEERWVSLHPLFYLAHEMTKDRMSLEPFEDIFRSDLSRFGCPWEYCSRLEIKAYRTLLWRPGEVRKTIFLVHSGKVGMFMNIPSDMSGGQWALPVSVFSRGQLLNHEAFRKVPTWFNAVAIEDGELLSWNEAQWTQLTRERPAMANALLQTMLKQEEDCEAIKAPTDTARRKTGFISVSEQDEGPICPAEEKMVSRRPPAMTGTEDLRTYLRPLETARGLAELGMYDSPGIEKSTRLTHPLIDHIQRDLTTAFHTFKTGEDETSFLAADNIGEALMYAGIFSLALTNEQTGDLSEAEFVDLGRQLATASLSKKQVDQVHNLFRQSAKRHRSVTREEATQLLRDHVFAGLPMEEVDDLISFCAGSSTRMVDEETFMAMIARLVQRHEREWCILQGIRSLLGGIESPDLSDRLTPDMLVQSQFTKLTEEEASEMLWSASFDSSRQEAGPSLSIRLVPVALWPNRLPALKLPPPPRPGPAPPPPAPERPLPPALGASDKATAAHPAVSDVVLGPAQPHNGAKHRLSSLFAAGTGGSGPPPKPMPPVFATEGCAALEAFEPDGARTPQDLVKPCTPPMPVSTRGEAITKASWSRRGTNEHVADVATKCLPGPHTTIGSASRVTTEPSEFLAPEELPALRTASSHPACSSRIRSLLAEVRDVSPSRLSTWPRLRCQRAALQCSVSRSQTTIMFSEEDPRDEVKADERPMSCRAKTHMFLDYPDSSKAAGCWSVVMSICIVVSVITLVLEPLVSPSDQERSKLEEVIWADLETFFSTVFTMEFLLRFSVADALGDQTWVTFVRTPMNLCDIMAVMPFYVDILIGTQQDHFRLFRLIRLMRLARLIRLGRLAGKSSHLAPIAVILVLIWGIFMKYNV